MEYVYRQHAIAIALALAFNGMNALAQLRPARTFILIGPPGSGKTTQAEYLRKRYKIPAISLPKLLAEEISRHSTVGTAAASSLASGEFLGDGPANDLMLARLLRPDAGRGFILDGYPSSDGQARALDRWLAERQMPKPTVIVLNVPEDVSRSRMLKRKGADDQPAEIERRLGDYRDIGRLVEKWYGADHVAQVDGTGTAAEVALRVANGIDEVQSRKSLLQRPAEPGGLKHRDDASEQK
jgi:adenylate kinase